MLTVELFVFFGGVLFVFLIALHAMILISVLQKALCRISVGAVFVRSHGWSLYDDIWFLAVPSGGDGVVEE